MKMTAEETKYIEDEMNAAVESAATRLENIERRSGVGARLTEIARIREAAIAEARKEIKEARANAAFFKRVGIKPAPHKGDAE